MSSFISVPCLSNGSFVRKPRSLKCDQKLSTRQVHRLRRGHLKTSIVSMSEVRESEIVRGPEPGDISSTRGFALQDAPMHDFINLRFQDDTFARGGAYAIRDEHGQVCYMGYSKNIAAKLQFHCRLVPEDCVSFQVYVPPVPAELISPEMLESVLEYWVRENGGVPKGNTVERHRWEKDESVERKSEQNTKTDDRKEEPTEYAEPYMDDVPVRERSTARRVSNRRSSSADRVDAFADNFRSSTGTRRRKRPEDGWSAKGEDNVEVNVDPLDPFSASKKRGRKSWDFESDDEEQEEDWVPIVALVGCAGLVWLLGVLSNTLPAASPSLGM